MNAYEKKLKNFLKENKVQAKHLTFKESCHSVEDAAKAVKAAPDDFIKNICFIDSNNRLIVAIIKGEDSVNMAEVGKILNIEKPRPATPEEILERTGYPCGGVPSFGYEAIFLIDPKVMEKEMVYSGGGSEYSLVQITPNQLVKLNRGQIVKIRK